MEPAVVRTHLAKRPVQGLLTRAAQQRVAGRLEAVEVAPGQQGVVAEHLLEVGDGP